jgi:excisionase family DNA binding protein
MTDRLALALTELVEALREEVRTEAAVVPQAPDQLLSVHETADALGIGRSATYGEIAAGRLASLTIGRRRLVPSSAVREYVEARRQ